MGWEDELGDVAGRYTAGRATVDRRRNEWQRCASDILMPTLERAAEILRKRGLDSAKAERCVFGTHLESVQLHTGQIDTGVRLDQEFMTKTKAEFPFVFEIGATLGYSLGVSGQVRRWQIEHWFETLEPKGLDALFRKHAKRQYEKELLFSTMVEVMALVVCRMQPG